MNQPELFHDDRYRPPARATDPVTSHQGAEHIRETAATLRKRMYLCFSARPKTAMECATECFEAFGGNLESYRKRSGELKRDGRIRVARAADGKTPLRRPCRVTGANAEVLEVRR